MDELEESIGGGPGETESTCLDSLSLDLFFHP